MKQVFYTPGWTDILNRTGQPVTVLDFDEVTKTSRVVFNDGFRAVVRTVDLTYREV